MRTHTVTRFALAALLGACASSQAPKELVDARAAYSRASHGPAAQVDPAELHDAESALGAAERAFADHGDTPRTRDLAYVAQRRAELAEVQAQGSEAAQKTQLTSAEMQKKRDAELARARSQVHQQEQVITLEEQALAQEQQRREEAEKRARQAAADLAAIASVKQETRGMVITLSGSVLFASGQSTLLPEAQVKLGQVADTLVKSDPDSKIVVQGYTDTQGPASFNQELSQKRAQAVREYLVTHGVAQDRVTAEGLGPANPVADNKTAEGRANNRRVEIVVQPPSK
jgi:outer membrane protein OmpA-like peptidoglycan-associated protein